MKHTPGPWTIKFDNHVDGPNNHSIDIVTEDWLDVEDFGNAWIGGVHQQFTSKENGWANAKLIACAPEMLDLLFRIADQPGVSHWAEEARLLVDKATK